MRTVEQGGKSRRLYLSIDVADNSILLAGLRDRVLSTRLLASTGYFAASSKRSAWRGYSTTEGAT
jgi:hypothetical protein